MKQGIRAGVGVMIGMLLAGCTFNMNLFGGGKALKEHTLKDGSEDKVLLLSIDGTITSHDSRTMLGGVANTVDAVKQQLDLARKDTHIVGVLLRIDSPGGGVGASDTILHEIRMYKQDTGIPVVAFFQNTAASGGYYVSMAADELIATPTCVVGSIGVLTVHVSIKEMMDKLGLEAQVVRTGKWKAIGLPFEPLDQEQLKAWHDEMRYYYDGFVDNVAGNRSQLSREQILELADGRVWPGRKALEVGLVDRIGYFDDALASLRQRANAPSARLITYTRTTDGNSQSIYSEHLAQADDQFPVVARLADELGLLSLRPGYLYYWSPGS